MPDQFRGQDFDCHLAPECRIVGAVNGAHAALAQFPGNAIASDSLAGVQHARCLPLRASKALGELLYSISLATRLDDAMIFLTNLEGPMKLLDLRMLIIANIFKALLRCPKPS